MITNRTSRDYAEALGVAVPVTQRDKGKMKERISHGGMGVNPHAASTYTDVQCNVTLQLHPECISDAYERRL